MNIQQRLKLTQATQRIQLWMKIFMCDFSRCMCVLPQSKQSNLIQIGLNLKLSYHHYWTIKLPIIAIIHPCYLLINKKIILFLCKTNKVCIQTVVTVLTSSNYGIMTHGISLHFLSWGCCFNYIIITEWVEQQVIIFIRENSVCVSCLSLLRMEMCDMLKCNMTLAQVHKSLPHLCQLSDSQFKDPYPAKF